MPRSLQSQALAFLALALTLSVGLGGCATGMLDQLPASVGGEPASLPGRPTTAYPYPAVHDMPPARSTAPLDDDQQIRMEKELQAARDRQESLYGPEKPPEATPGAPSGAKKKPAAAKGDQTSGAKANP